MFAHETTDFLGVHHHAAMAELDANAPVAIGFKLVANRLHLGNNSGVARASVWCVIEGRAADPH
jgi:hypothetical protein